MNTIKLLSAAVLLATASGAFASEFDGKSDNAWLAKTTVSTGVQAPAPTAAAATARDDFKAEAAAQQGSNNEVTVP